MAYAELQKVNIIPAGPSENIPALSEASAVLNMIERAARDPSVDIDKLQRLMEMRKTIEIEVAERAFNRAMKDAQAEMRPISADANNPQTRSKYATYAKLDRILRPIYTKHGFALSFDEGDSPKPEHIRVLCYVSHDAGFTRPYRKDMPADGKGAKGGDVMTKTHAAGAASSYGARYLLKGIFNVAVGEDDSDGNAAADHGDTVSSDQVKELIELIRAKNANEALFLKYYRIERLVDLPVSRFADAVSRLKAKGG
jgi:hypothetical protein